MKATKRILSALLVLVICIGCVPLAAAAEDTYSSAVYMIFTNPGEDCNSQMRIGWHSDYENAGCYVMYTTADDENFANAVRADGEYDDQAYMWFYNRLTTNTLSDSRFTTKFLDWSVELDNLTPNTAYIYRVYDGEGLYSETHKFCTSGADEYSIIWMSDAHVNTQYVGRLNDWRKTFAAAEKVAKYPIGFQFYTGDTVTSGDRYADWLSVANESFSKNYMIADLVGNHDVYDGIMDDDTPYYTDFWKSGEYFGIAFNNPKNGYTFNSQRIGGYLNTAGLSEYADKPADELLEMPDGSGKLFTGAVDNTDGRCYWFNYNGILFIIFEYYSMMFAGDTQAALDWAGQVIEQNEGKYDYIICANHVNLVNGGSGDFRDYGATDYEFFGKLFDEYNVDAFFGGDNHVYLRTASIFGGAVNTDPEKGTYIVQAPCISRAQAFDAKGPAGFAVNQYSLKNQTVGGIIIDVDEFGLNISCLVKEAEMFSSKYEVYDTFTIPRKTRESNRLEVKEGAKFTANSRYVNVEAGTTVQDIIDGFANPTVEVVDAKGAAMKPTDVLTGGEKVTVRNEGFTYPAGEMTVKIAFTPGDANNDGAVDNLDAVLILKADADTGNAEVPHGDINGDGKADNLDATIILQLDAGLEVDY